MGYKGRVIAVYKWIIGQLLINLTFIVDVYMKYQATFIKIKQTKNQQKKPTHLRDVFFFFFFSVQQNNVYKNIYLFIHSFIKTFC